MVDILSDSAILDWWAYGIMNNWFPESKGSRAMSPEQAEQALAELYGPKRK